MFLLYLIVVKVTIYIHLVISVIITTYKTTQAISVYLFAVAALLLGIIILMIIHWRHQVNQRSKDRKDGISLRTINELNPDTEEKHHLMNTPSDETDARNYFYEQPVTRSYSNYSSPNTPSYTSYNNFYRVDDDLKNLQYQKAPSYEREYQPITGTPMVPMNHYQFYPNVSRGQTTYPNETIFIDENRKSHYDNLAPNYLPNYQVNYLKNSDLI